MGFEIQEPEAEVVPNNNEHQKQEITNGKNHDDDGESFLLRNYSRNLNTDCSNSVIMGILNIS